MERTMKITRRQLRRFIKELNARDIETTGYGEVEEEQEEDLVMEPHYTPWREGEEVSESMMKITRRQLRQIIKEEMGHMTGSGKCPSCGKMHTGKCAHHREKHAMDDSDAWASGQTLSHDMMMPGDHMDVDSAFGAGYNMGQEERGMFDYTGDLSDLTPDEAIGLGYEAGKMGLGGGESHPPDPQSYDAVIQFLESNPELIDMAVSALMEMTGATCPKSTMMAVADYLGGEDSSMGHDAGPAPCGCH